MKNKLSSPVAIAIIVVVLAIIGFFAYNTMGDKTISPEQKKALMYGKSGGQQIPANILQKVQKPH